MAVLQKENAAVAMLECRLLTAEQALAREGAGPRIPAPSAESEPPLSEAGRAYLLDMQAQLISLELELGEERKKCAFMQVPHSLKHLLRMVYDVPALAGWKVREMAERGAREWGSPRPWGFADDMWVKKFTRRLGRGLSQLSEPCTQPGACCGVLGCSRCVLDSTFRKRSGRGWVSSVTKAQVDHDSRS